MSESSGLTPAHDALLAALAQNSNKLANAALDLRESFQFSRRMKVTLAIGGVVVVLLLFCVATLIVLAITNKSAIDAIHDCTNPSGQCAKNAQRQTATAVASIIALQKQVDIAITVCASSSSVVNGANADNDNAYTKALTVCVNKRLARS